MESLDIKGYAGTILMDLSKAFDTISHELLIAKLYAYGFDKNALTLVLNYLSNRWQRTKINASFTSWHELMQARCISIIIKLFEIKSLDNTMNIGER